mmetsp:Transcript_2506/g.6913  ORF Transcript_2506/g.6913 Transcript_2506/m.6913 type:complete len:210 (-) Transcript_2506:292-921(-)
MTEAYQTMFGIFSPLSLAQNGTIRTANSAITAPLDALVIPKPKTCAVYPMKRYVASSVAAVRSFGLLKAPVFIPKGRNARAAIPNRTRFSVEGLVSVSVSLISTWLLPKSAAARFTSAMDPTVAKVHFMGASPSAPSPVAARTSWASSSPGRTAVSSREDKLARAERFADLRQAAKTVSSMKEKFSSVTALPSFRMMKVSSISKSSSLV